MADFGKRAIGLWPGSAGVLASRSVTVDGQGRPSPSIHGCIYSVSQIEMPAPRLYTE